MKPSLRIIGTLLLLAPAAWADVKLPAIFGDHMVLQQGVKLPVWGWAEPGEDVTVAFANRTAKAVAGPEGKWRVNLEPVQQGSSPGVLTVTGKNTLRFEDVLVGDVWLASGQSNMEFALSRSHTAREDVPHANDSQLRFFSIPRTARAEEQSDVVGKWQVCTPESIGGFSAVAYYFGRELRSTLKQPVGLIGSYWGGTTAQAWTSLSGLEKAPAFSQYVQQAKNNADNYLKLRDGYPQLLQEFQQAKAQWDTEVKPVFTPVLQKWVQEAKAAKAAGQPLPSKPEPSRPEPKAPRDPNPGPQATALYNGMIAPLIPYAIKGAIWYQGESNAANAPEYEVLFPRMISDWREKWKQGDFPFLYVELASFQPGPKQADYGKWARLREAQLKTLSLPQVGMASAVDLGNPKDIHPTDKRDVGLRLALAAQHVAYGKNCFYSGPIYSGMKTEGSKIRLSFTSIGGGLTIGVPPWTPDGSHPEIGTELTGFTVAGSDSVWHPATARIEGQNVIVWSEEVTKPVAVRYGWADVPRANLYNKEGLPASPFRTDSWPQTDEPKAEKL